MTVQRAARPWSWVPLVGLIAMLPSCETSVRTSDEVQVDSPTTPAAYRTLAAELRREGKHKEAGDAALKAYTLARTGPRVAERIELAKTFAASAGAASNETERGRAVASAINEIKSLEREKREQGLAVDEVEIAEVYALLGDPNAVFRWLDRAVAANSPKIAGIADNPDLEPVKSDPRWQEFLSSIQ